jgi:hypothetical protein
MPYQADRTHNVPLTEHQIAAIIDALRYSTDSSSNELAALLSEKLKEAAK